MQSLWVLFKSSQQDQIVTQLDLKDLYDEVSERIAP